MSHVRPRPPSGILRQLMARLQPAAAMPAAASLAFMMLAPAALAQTADPANTAQTTLPTVKVEDTSDPMEVNNGYQGTQTRVGKTRQDPQDIPQAITVVTQQLMQEQHVGSLRDALRNVSGLTFNAAEGGRAGDNMMLRGFYTFGDVYLDGIRDTAQYNRETFFLEQVDVLRGSASMLFGRGQAGGVINLVSKTPKLADAYKLTGSVGTDNYTEVTADLNKQLGEHSAVRVNLMKRDEGSWRENPASGAEPDVDRGGAQVSLALGMNTDDEFTFSHLTMRNRDTPDYGFSFDNATHRPNTTFPVDYFWGIDRNFDNSDVNVTTGTWTHRFADDSQLRTTVRYGDYERSYWARTPSATIAPNADGTLPGNGGNWNAGPTRSTDYETLTLQSDYSRKFEALGMKHEFLTGVEYLHENSHRSGLQNLGGTTIASGIPPLFLPYVESYTGAQLNNFTGNSYALYAQDTVEFIPDWKATLGVRRDELDADYSSAASPHLEYGEWSYRAALSYQPTEEAHYYVGYSDSFSPTADLYQLTATPQPPETSQVYEVGAKWMFFDGDLSFRTALYRAIKNWERNTDLESTASILTKKRRTDGIEFEAAGRITPNWEVFAGLALMDATILEVAEQSNGNVGDPRYVGKRPRNTPPYTFNLWSTYKLGGGWKIGGGAEAKGERYGYNPSSSSANAQFTTNGQPSGFNPNTAPAYVRWDAMVSYDQKTWGVRLNVQNLFNKTYYDSIYDNGPFTVPGQKRRFILTGELKF